MLLKLSYLCSSLLIKRYAFLFYILQQLAVSFFRYENQIDFVQGPQLFTTKHPQIALHRIRYFSVHRHVVIAPLRVVPPRARAEQNGLFNLFIISSTKRPSTFILITLKKVYPKPARFASNCGLFAPRSRRILSKITKNASYYFLFRCFSAFIVIYS